jgi:hypothetical protein
MFIKVLCYDRDCVDKNDFLCYNLLLNLKRKLKNLGELEWAMMGVQRVSIPTR